MGNLTAKADKESENDIAGNVDLTGNGNDITATGKYHLNDAENQFDIDLLLKRLNFKTVEAVSEEAISRSSGNINGEIKVNGKFADPRWNGQINFDTTAFTLTALGTPFRINKQKIVLEYPDIKLPEFTITDSLNHPLKIDGAISFRSMNDVGLNVDINTNDFIFVNAKRSINSQIYGYGSVDANMSVTGTGKNRLLKAI